MIGKRIILITGGMAIAICVAGFIVGSLIAQYELSDSTAQYTADAAFD